MSTSTTRTHTIPRRLLAAGLVSVLAACGGARATPAPAPAPAPAAAGDSLRVTAEAIARARADSARLPWTEADARFMTMMIAHHAQAVTMSRMAPTHEASAQLRTLAERIINAQFDEIRLMRRWLLERERPAPDPLGAAAGHAGHAGMDHGAMGHGTTMDHGAGMPGMLTPEQLRQLDQARGREFDRLFLTFMIRHHEGAVQMVDELFATAGAAQDLLAFEIASDVQVDQRTEIARMRRMLVQLEVGS